MVPPLPPPEPVSRRRLASQASMDTQVSLRPSGSTRFQRAKTTASANKMLLLVPLCMPRGSEYSSSDEDSPLGRESRDDCVTSDSRTGPDEGVALTCGPTLSVEPAEGPASEEFAVIAGKHNMTHACINDVLDFCRRRRIVDLPDDARTVLKTERKAQVELNGSLVRFGLEEGIPQVLPQVQALPSELKLQVNIDEVPLYKSSQLAFWPI
ncbi:hypothetical protein MTO96_039209 [Rhipicephalus appendiculatus]